ncbi:MAG: hypothetical protein DWQ05_04185 [Calditrichaeota bacterium]|nr:MAG: hypothetical protein DWQ05_04185 [Calditrichota bacterium]
MKKIIKDLAVYIVLFTVVAGSLWIVNDIQQNSLDNALTLMGNRLAAMASGPEEQENLKKIFEKFVNQVFNNEVSPEQVEKVAANIINLSNSDAKLSREQVETILSAPDVPLITFSGADFDDTTAQVFSEMNSGIVSFSFEAPKTTGNGIKTSGKSRKPSVAAVDWETVGDRVAVVFEANAAMQKLNQNREDAHQEFNYIVDHDSKNGIRFLVSENESRANKELQKKLYDVRDPDGRELVVWQKNFDRAMEHKKRTITREIKVLQKRILRQERDSLRLEKHQTQALQYLAQIKELEAMTVQIKLDSLLINITSKIEPPGEAKQ